MDRRNKGLCFKCGEKFHPLHQCSEKSLRLVVVEEEDDEGGEILALKIEKGKERDELECKLAGGCCGT